MKHLALKRLWIRQDDCLCEDGQALSEYSVLLMLVALVAIGASTSLGQSVVDFLLKAITTIGL